jgi:anaerobic magnesium-protoporphyrin IX monomethyl ester cyclase
MGMRILFVIRTLDYADHISLAYLSAVAKSKGHETFLCNMAETDLITRLIDVFPKVVAYSCNVMDFKAIVEQQARIRYMGWKMPISIMGGPHPTFSPETFLQSGMDAYCIGEGEGAFADFLDRIDKGESFYDIPNIVTRFSTNPVRNLVSDLDSLPFPDRDLTLSNTYLKGIPKKTFYTTRGCPFSCNYCCNNYYHELYKGKGKFVRRFSVDRIIREIQYVQKRYRMDFLKFGDDLFAMNADEWLEEFSDKYSRKVRVPFNCYLRFDRVDEKLLTLLKKAGCYSVHLSVDSVSPYIREDILNRRMRSIHIADSLKMIRSFEIRTWVNFMTAIPESTLQDDLDTIKLARESDITYLSYCTTDPMKGTKLYDYCVEKGYLDSEYIGDMSKITTKSPLKCFTKYDKDIRYNITLLGPIVAKLPWPLYRFGMFLIKKVPPNRVFKWIRNIYYKYSITHTIFKLPKGEIWRQKNI